MVTWKVNGNRDGGKQKDGGDPKRDLGSGASEGLEEPPPPPCSILPEVEVGFPLEMEHSNELYPHQASYSAHLPP